MALFDFGNVKEKKVIRHRTQFGFCLVNKAKTVSIRDTCCGSEESILSESAADEVCHIKKET